MRRQSIPFLVGATFLALLGIVSCSEETPTYLAPIYQVGALEGYVTVAGQPRAVTVGAREVGGAGRVIAKTQSGEDGWYRLELPVDRYRIEVNPSNSGISSPDTSDVVRVEPRNKRLDLRYGRLVIRVETPEATHGLWLDAGSRSTGQYPERSNTRKLVESPGTELTLDFLEPGIFTVWLSLPGGTRYYLPGTYDETSAQQIPVPVNQETVVEASLSQYATLSGSVTGSWQQVQTYGPRVTAFTMDMQAVSSTNVAEDGTFQLRLLIAEPLRIQVRNNKAVKQWLGGNSFETAQVFHPQAGEDTGGVDLVESGILVQLQGPASFLAHEPSLLVTDGNGWEHELIYNSAADSYPITNLLPGRYYLRAAGTCAYSPQPWRPQWFGGSESLEGATPIDLPAGSLVPVTMQLEPGGVLEGQVKLDGLVSGLRVGIFDTAGTPLCNNFLWRQDGGFRIPGLLDGDYLLAAISGGDQWFYPGTLNVGNAVPISVRNAETVSGIIWTLELR